MDMPLTFAFCRRSFSPSQSSAFASCPTSSDVNPINERNIEWPSLRMGISKGIERRRAVTQSFLGTRNYAVGRNVRHGPQRIRAARPLPTVSHFKGHQVSRLVVTCQTPNERDYLCHHNRDLDSFRLDEGSNSVAQSAVAHS